MWDEVHNLTINDYKRCIAEMKKAHPFIDDERVRVDDGRYDLWPYVVVTLDVDGTEIVLRRKVTHEETKRRG